MHMQIFQNLFNRTLLLASMSDQRFPGRRARKMIQSTENVHSKVKVSFSQLRGCREGDMLGRYCTPSPPDMGAKSETG